MSDAHLIELRKKLQQNNWKIHAEKEGNNYEISVVWLISRLNENNMLHLEFAGLNDTETLPMKQSYGCRLKENPNVSLYFARISRSWVQELDRFTMELNNIAITTL